ncbi:MAG: fumarate reductase iron-sulfur subunit, partial [Nitrospinota bacterium]
MDSVIVQVHRFHPEQEPGSYIQTYEVPVAEKTTVLDLLCQIQSTQD